MSATWQLSRHGSLWLLLAFAVSAAPLLRFLPLWLGAAGAVAIYWRIQILRARVGAPGRAVKLGLVVLCVAGLLVSFGRLDGLEPMVSLLISAYALKLLEMRNRRDALMTVYLGYFTAIVQCLFDQGMLTALLVALALVVVTAGLAGINMRDQRRAVARPLKTALLLVAQALPLMLVLFVVMPRLEPLWSVPSPSGGAVTGMSDTMAPGDVTRLGRSAQIAFRAQFDGPMPPRHQLYWRGVVLSNFDGRTWSQGGEWGLPLPMSPGQADLQFSGEEQSYRYGVVMERTGNRWLYGLDVPQPLSPGVGLSRDYTLGQRAPVNSRTGYQVRSWPNLAMDGGGLEHWQWLLNTRLPEQGNPRTREVVRQWLSETAEPVELLDRLLALFNESFVYTLQPPPLGRHTVDDFLWSTRAGFCEHFASAFVFFARAAGIPARVVGGYQGGEAHPGGYLIVRQYDAHAWAEVWLENRGWVRVDPTAAVAPERIERSLLDLFGGEGMLFADSPLSLVRFREVAWINWARLHLDQFEYAWSRWVIGYDDIQWGLLQHLLGGAEPLRIALFLVLGGLLALAPVLAVSLWPGRRLRRNPLDRQFVAFGNTMARLGLPRQPGEAAGDYARRCALRHPDLAPRIQTIAAAYQRGRYAGDSSQAVVLAREVAALRRVTLLRGG